MFTFPSGRFARITTAVSAAALALSLTACGSGSDSGDSGASGADADKVVVYSGRSEDLIAPLLEKFTADTGVEVEARYAGSGELAAQLITEGDASPADVFLSQDAGALGAVSKAGLFAPINPETLAAVPASYSAADGTWVGVSGRARVIVYNPELAPTVPDTIDGLLAPEWKGKIGFAPSNASWQAFVTGLRVTRGDDAARQWLQAFAAQEPRPYEGNGPLRDAVNSGEVPLGLTNHYYLYELINSTSADQVKARNQFMAPGDPGGLVNVAGVGVLKSASHPEQAQELAAYLVSTAGQEYFATETTEYPLIAGIAPNGDMPALADLQPPAVDLSQLDDLEATQEMLVETGLLTN
ncbi:iron ABC transporter substrate-binding protein [Mycobacterium sp. 236(2023)]|uniref:iron ABC transporter substrate-binding protein n=1 Tax=Mycobacterium sp. 236(2023) TaxID=3038163 RepID=UPI00241535EB|nr:iron ABC transporter substrate-binding protein [Mycobacterium sp. 236(2023)]MDG4666888.1 iron ABC transporter substrate-binding protein [Mycobacterium sp. 236(2023)]